MRQKFAVNLFFLIAANLLVKPFWIFGIDRVVQNRVGPEEYGTFFAVFNFSYILSIVLDFGINNFNNRAVARHRSRAGEYLLNLFLLKLYLSAVYFVATFAMAWASGFSAVQMEMLFFLAANQVLLSVLLFLRSNVAALQYFKTDALLSVLDRLLAVIFCGALLWRSNPSAEFDIMWFIYAQTLALLLSGLVALWVLRGKISRNKGLWKPKFTRLILLKSAPFALLALLMGIYYRIDAVMLERMLPSGKTEAGIYAAAYRLLDAFNQFGYLFATLLLPLFARMLRQREDIRDILRFGGELMFSGSVTLAMACFFYAESVMHLLYPAAGPYWVLIFQWLMVSFVPMSSVYVFGTLLTAHGSLKMLNLIALSGALINVCINLAVIPRYGALGATIATLITQSVVAIGYWLAAQRIFQLRFRMKQAVRLLAHGILTVLVFWGLSSGPFFWALALGISLVFSAVVMVLSGIVSVSDIRSFTARKSAS